MSMPPDTANMSDADVPAARPPITPAVSRDTHPTAEGRSAAAAANPVGGDEREPAGSAEESAEDDLDTTRVGEEDTTPTPADSAPPARPAWALAPAYDLQAQTVTLVIQLQPTDEHAQGRPVLVSVRAGTQAPIFAAPLRYNDLGALPGPVTALLQQLQLRAMEQKRKAQAPTPARPAAAPPVPSVAPAAASRAASSAGADAPDPNAQQLTMF